MISERGLEVLRVIVQDYVASREPVGSKRIVERHPFGVSAATIRNDMAALEEEELIAAPHTSSGRVPTDKGYRLFVDELSDVRPLTRVQRHAIEQFLGQSVDLEDVYVRTVRVLAQLTHQVALVQFPTVTSTQVRHVELVSLAPTKVMSILISKTGVVEQRVVDVRVEVSQSDLDRLAVVCQAAVVDKDLVEAQAALDVLGEGLDPTLAQAAEALAVTLAEQIESNRDDRMLVAGAANLVRTESDFTTSVHSVLDAIEEQVVLLRLFSEMVADQNGVAVSIGRENESFGLAETSVLTSGYSATGGRAKLGVLGPTRMDYSSNVAAVRAVARYLTRLLGNSS